MSKSIKSAFDNIHAEEQLKETTLARIYENKESKKGFFERFKIKRVATVLACFVPLFIIGLFSYNTYFTESAYVDLDINPSVELSVNRFDRVIGANAYNEDGENLLASIDIKNEKIDAVLQEIINLTAEDGTLEKEGLVSVTVQTGKNKEEKLLEEVEAIMDSALSSYEDMESDIFAVDSHVKATSHDMHLTPAKYLAILELQKVDPTATVDQCRHHSISNIKQLTSEHNPEHEGDSSDSEWDDEEHIYDENEFDNWDESGDSNGNGDNSDNSGGTESPGNSGNGDSSGGSGSSGHHGESSSGHGKETEH